MYYRIMSYIVSRRIIPFIVQIIGTHSIQIFRSDEKGQNISFNTLVTVLGSVRLSVLYF